MVGFWTGVWTSVILAGWIFAVINHIIPMIIIFTFLGLVTSTIAGYIEAQNLYGKKDD